MFFSFISGLFSAQIDNFVKDNSMSDICGYLDSYDCYKAIMSFSFFFLDLYLMPMFYDTRGYG